MEAGDGSQKALQIAFQTLKERCTHFQQHIAALEAENVKLRGQQTSQGDTDSLCEADVQKRRIRELLEQNMQLQTHLDFVSNENQQLWTKLSKLSEVNESLGTQLTKINDSLSQNSPKKPVARTQTYTIDGAHKRPDHRSVVDENEKVSLELEDISLKLINNIAKEKMELELQCSEMMQIQNSNLITKTSVDENEFKETFIDEYLQNFNSIKYVLLEEKNKLTKILQNLGEIKKEGGCCHLLSIKNAYFCCVSAKKSHVGVQTVTIVEAQAAPEEILTNNQTVRVENLNTSSGSLNVRNQQSVIEEDSLQPDISDVEKICPVCSLTFTNDTTFMEFQNHVVEHFVVEDHPDYEVV